MAFNYRKKGFEILLIFIARIVRMFTYGMLVVVFMDSLFYKGINEAHRILIQIFIIVGDILISLLITTQAEKIGRINTLIAASILKVIAGLCFAQANSFYVLVASGMLGISSIMGEEMGPFMSIQQSTLSQIVEGNSESRKQAEEQTVLLFGYYNLAGYFSQSVGVAFASYFMDFAVDSWGYEEDEAIASVVSISVFLTIILPIVYFILGRGEVQSRDIKQNKELSCSGLHQQSFKTIAILAILFLLNAVGGGYIIQTDIEYYYQRKYNFYLGSMGGILFIFKMFSGISGVLSSKLVNKIGLTATMIYTHLSSNLLLILIGLIGLTNNPQLSIILLFCRFSIAQIDVPARQAYVSLAVSSEERSAANGLANILTRIVGMGYRLELNRPFLQKPINSPQYSYPFLIAGGIKIIYDLLMAICFLCNEKSQNEQNRVYQARREHMEIPSLQQEDIRA